MSMTDSELGLNPNKRRKGQGVSSFTSSTSIDRDYEPRQKTVIHTNHVPPLHTRDQELLHDLNGHCIVRHSHTPFRTGGFCDIFTGDHPKYGKVALRRPRLTQQGYTERQLKNFYNESRVWNRLRHPNILPFLGLIETDRHIWAVSRFAENGSVTEYLKTHPDADRPALVCQLADAIRYLHRRKYIHGDIKGSNVLISAAATVLLSDFGLLKLSGTLTRTSLRGAGSSRWCAPELLFDDKARKTNASDIYAFGMTVYELLSGNKPYDDISGDFQLVTAIRDGKRPPKEPPASKSGDSYAQLWDIVSESWNDVPAHRRSMEAVCERLGVPDTLSCGTVVEDTSRMDLDRPASTSALAIEDAESVLLQVVGGNSSQIESVTDDEIIQKLPRATAQYNSLLRRGAQRCLQDTRAGLLQTIHEWIDGTGPHQEPIFWLSGEAGTGKSTIAHTIAEDRDGCHQLGASFFFSRNEEARRDANLFISTLAYQLSIFDIGFKAHLAALLRRDPTLPEKTIKIQLKEMVMEPLKKTKTLATKTIVIVVDALDECDPDSGAEEILEAWTELIQHFPLRILITSRPSWHIQARVSSSRHTSTVFHLHDISKTIVKSDVEHYLRVSLAGVLEGGLADNDVERLTQRVGLLFILASTYVKYIKDPIRKNPSGQLRALLSRTPTLGRSPEGELNALYLDIVKGVPEDEDIQAVIDAFKRVVGAMIVSGIPMTPLQLSNFLKMDQGDVLYILRRLSSVIFLPDDTAPASFFHQSFSEFLTDPKRCTNRLYAMDKSETHRCMALSSESDDLSVSDTLPAFDDLQAFEQETAQDSEIPEAISLSTSKAYPDSLCYACVYLPYHLQGMVQRGNNDDPTCLERFEAFYTQKRTQWLDVITSLHDIPGLSDLPARLHSGYIKYYQSHTQRSQRTLEQMFSFQRKLQPPKEQIPQVPDPIPQPPSQGELSDQTKHAIEQENLSMRTHPSNGSILPNQPANEQPPLLSEQQQALLQRNQQGPSGLTPQQIEMIMRQRQQEQQSTQQHNSQNGQQRLASMLPGGFPPQSSPQLGVQQPGQDERAAALRNANQPLPEQLRAMPLEELKKKFVAAQQKLGQRENIIRQLSMQNPPPPDLQRHMHDRERLRGLMTQMFRFYKLKMDEANAAGLLGGPGPNQNRGGPSGQLNLSLNPQDNRPNSPMSNLPAWGAGLNPQQIQQHIQDSQLMHQTQMRNTNQGDAQTQ